MPSLMECIDFEDSDTNESSRNVDSMPSLVPQNESKSSDDDESIISILNMHCPKRCSQKRQNFEI